MLGERELIVTSHMYHILNRDTLRLTVPQSISLFIRSIWQHTEAIENFTMSVAATTHVWMRNIYQSREQYPEFIKITVMKPLTLYLRNLYRRFQPEVERMFITLPESLQFHLRNHYQRLITNPKDEVMTIGLPNSTELWIRDLVNAYDMTHLDWDVFSIHTPNAYSLELKNVLNKYHSEGDDDFQLYVISDFIIDSTCKPAIDYPLNLQGVINEHQDRIDNIFDIDLTWVNTSLTHTAYLVYRDTVPIPRDTTMLPYATIDYYAEAFNDPSVEEDTTYYYRVMPKSIYGRLFSNQVTLMVPLSLRAPSNVTGIFSSLSETRNVSVVIETLEEPILSMSSYDGLSKPKYTKFSYEPSLDFTYVTFEATRLHRAVVTGKSYDGLSTLLELSADFTTQQSVRNFISSFNGLTTVGSAKHSVTIIERPVYMQHSFAGLTKIDANDPYVRLDSAVLDPNFDYTSQSSLDNVAHGYQGLTATGDLVGEYNTLFNVDDVQSSIDTQESVFDLRTNFKSLDNVIDAMQNYDGLTDVTGVNHSLVDISIADGSSTFDSLTGTNQANVHVTNLKDLTDIRFSVEQGTNLSDLTAGFSSLDNLLMDSGECPIVLDIYPPEGFIAGCVVAGHENEYKAFDPTFEGDIAITTGELRTFNQRFGDMRRFLSRDNFTFINSPRKQETGTLDLSTIQINRINECVFIWGSSFSNWSGDAGFGLYEFLDADHNLVFSLKNINTGSFSTAWMFTSNNGVTQNLGVRSYGYGHAFISFGDSKLWVESSNQGSGPNNHSFNCEYEKVVYLRTSAQIHNSYTGGTGVTSTYLYLRESIPNPPKPVCAPKDLFNSLTGTSAINQSMNSLSGTSLIQYAMNDVPMLDDLSQEYTSLDSTERVSSYAMTLEGVHLFTSSCSTAESCKIDGNSYSSLDSSLVMEPVYSSYSKPMSLLGGLTTLEDVSNIHIHNSSEMVLDMYYKGFSSLSKTGVEAKDYASLDTVGVTSEGYWVYPEEPKLGSVLSNPFIADPQYLIYVGRSGDKLVYLDTRNDPASKSPIITYEDLQESMWSHILQPDGSVQEDANNLELFGPSIVPAVFAAKGVERIVLPFFDDLMIAFVFRDHRYEPWATAFYDLFYNNGLSFSSASIEGTREEGLKVKVHCPYYGVYADAGNYQDGSVEHTSPLLGLLLPEPEPYYVQGGVQYTSQEAVKILNATMPWQPGLP